VGASHYWRDGQSALSHRLRLGRLSPVQTVLLLAMLVAAIWLAYTFSRQPTNNADWEVGTDTLPIITIQDSTVLAHNVRDFRYTPDGMSDAAFTDRTLDASHIQQVWFVVEPFTIPPFNSFEGAAHTYFVFDFQDQPPLAISVEARRQRGQTFDVISGLFNQFELIYIWGSEQDVTGSRALVEKHSLYMYPLTIPADSAEALFLQLSQTSAQLDVQPRFYNSLTSNCTNELAKAANAAHPGAIPLNIGLIMPGYSDKVLYDLGFIPHDAPFQELRQRYSVADVVLADYGRPDFSSLLRGELKRRESGPA
jgi:hypothetical protein